MKQIARVVWPFALVIAFGVISTTPAAGQTSTGIRAGLSVDPDQFYFGGHLETPPLVDRLRFKPNAEIGVGKDVTVVALNLEFAYGFPSQRGWNAYAGAGPALIISDRDSNTNSGGGFNMLLGVSHRSGLFTEIKIGVVDSPELKIGVGYSFR